MQTSEALKLLSAKVIYTKANILVDTTGIKIQDEREWKVKVHGKGNPRKWIKLHVALDAKTQEIIGEMLTEASVDDEKAFLDVMSQVPNRVNTVIADGAYDDKEVRDSIKRRRAKALIAPPKNSICHESDSDRDDAVLSIRGLGEDKIAKSIWGKLSGYSQRALVETAFSRHKKIFGDRFFSRTSERQKVESRLKCVILNKMIRAAA